jgi:DNA polymerase sigma
MKQLKIDITFNTEGYRHMGMQCCRMIKEQIGRFPEGLIETQVLLIKKLLALKNLNSPYRGKNLFLIIIGGLSSYGVVLMLISFLNSDPL